MSFGKSINCNVGIGQSVDQRNAWNQTCDGARVDRADSSIDRSNGAVNANQNGMAASWSVSITNSVNPSTVKAKKAIFKGLKDI